MESNGKLKENQAGFRSKRSTVDQVFVLNSMIGKNMRERKKLHVAFIDLKAAFDTVDRKIMLEKLEKKGVKGRFLNFVKNIYDKTLCRIIKSEGISKSFETSVGVPQGCALSATLFSIFIDDMDDTWETGKTGGTVMGRTKIYALKYADDVAVVAEYGQDPQQMLKQLEKYEKKNKLEVNTNKTKVMVFGKGKKTKNEQKWFYKNKKLEVVKSFKYLGCWFTNGNSWKGHTDQLANEAQKRINTVWGMIKRARRNTLNKSLYLYKTLVSAGALYAAEIWGMKGRVKIKRVYNRMVQSALGIAKNTPNYIWEVEAGVESINIITKKRAVNYIKKVIQMPDERLPKIILKEECRRINNRNETKWGSELANMLKKMKITEVIKQIAENNDTNVITEKLEKGMTTIREEEKKRNSGRIRESTVAPRYKFVRTCIGVPQPYWGNNKIRWKDQETWTRLRCGNIGRAGKNGFKNQMCRVCSAAEKTLEHIIDCGELKLLCREKD